MADETIGPKMRKVLCVIPDEDTFELLRLELLDHGYEARHVAGLQSALQAARTGDFDIYIIDNWWLTDGDGIGLCREIRRDDPSTPILFYSSNAFPSEIARALEAGAQDYIALPDISGELPGKVDKLVNAAENRSRAIQQETRRIGEHLSERMTNVARMKEASLQVVDQALQNVLRANALADFIRAGGKRTQFDQLWPRALAVAVGCEPPTTTGSIAQSDPQPTPARTAKTANPAPDSGQAGGGKILKQGSAAK